MATLRIQDGSKFFSESVALYKVNFAIDTAQSICLVGKNGAGKSTLLRCIASLQSFDEGTLVHDFKRRAFVSDQSFLYADLTLIENFTLTVQAAGFPNSKAYIAELISTFELGEHRDKALRDCSRGVTQKAAIIRALLLRPDLLLLDEPFSNLDSEGREVLSAYIEELQASGGTVVLAVHEEDIVQRHGARVIQLETGKLTRDEIRLVQGVE